MANIVKYVNSSIIRYVSYHTEAEEMNIGFHSGEVYTYRGVKKNRFTRLCKAPSAGAYFHEKVRHAYPYRRRDFRIEANLNQIAVDSE